MRFSLDSDYRSQVVYLGLSLAGCVFRRPRMALFDRDDAVIFAEGFDCLD
jgi:hypothetical protein